jgi:hypothetical protein
MKINKWKELSDNKKVQYKRYCDTKYGRTSIFCESGEPMYIDNVGNIINTNIVIDLLINIETN